MIRVAPKSSSIGKRPELALVFEETVALYLRLSAASVSIYRRGQISGPRRTVLVALARSGPQTVASLARARAQSRQRIQALVDALLRERLVERHGNPAHKRSHLISLTPRGHAAVREVVETEGALRERLRLRASPQRLASTARVLREIREALDDQAEPLIAAYRRRRRRRS